MSAVDKIAEIQARRDARKAQEDNAASEQKATDLEAIFALECDKGPSNVKAMSVPYCEGLPCMVAVVTPSAPALSRYRARVKPDRSGRPGDRVAAAEEIAGVCVKYPTPEQFEALCEARPGLKAQAGAMAIELVLGQEESEGKE